MNRKEFLQRAGLGAAGLFLVPQFLQASFSGKEAASDVVDRAISFVLAHGALYADARLGPCEIKGNAKGFAPLALLETELLGMRISLPTGWRQVVLRDLSEKGLEKGLIAAMQPFSDSSARGKYWISAHFSGENLVAHRSTDPSLEPSVNLALLRYGRPQMLPPNAPDMQFCDVILQY